jgi:glycosyltransferase involved in cell wall biosynthesis
MAARAQAVVSVCVPALNAEPFLAATVESVLAQTMQSWELIIVDNASSDRTGEIARSFDDERITVVTNDRTVPMADNWNRAVELSGAPYVKLLCADDLLEPGSLATQLAAMERDETAVMVAGRRHVIDRVGRVVLRNRGLNGLLGTIDGTEALRRVVVSGTNIIGWPAAVLFKRADFEAVGRFGSAWPLLIDLELWARLLARGRFIGVDEPAASFRVWETSASATAGAALGRQHRQFLDSLAADSANHIARWELAVGNTRSRVESVKRWLLFSALTVDSALVGHSVGERLFVSGNRPR